MTIPRNQLTFTIQICSIITLTSFILMASFFTGKLVGINAANPTKFAKVRQEQRLALDLSKTNARLEMAETTNKLNSKALEQTRQTIVQLEQQIYQQQKQIIAYKSIISKQKPSSNLVVRDVIIQATLIPQHFKYKIILTRSDPVKTLLTGQLQILIEGTILGKTKILSLAEISTFAEHKKNIAFSFKYITLIPDNNQFAEMVLPTDFTPKKVKIIAYLKGNNNSINKELPWSVKPLPEIHQPL